MNKSSREEWENQNHELGGKVIVSRLEFFMVAKKTLGKFQLQLEIQHFAASHIRRYHFLLGYPLVDPHLI